MKLLMKTALGHPQGLYTRRARFNEFQENNNKWPRMKNLKYRLIVAGNGIDLQFENEFISDAINLVSTKRFHPKSAGGGQRLAWA